MKAVNPLEVFDDGLSQGETFASVRRAHPRFYEGISQKNCEMSRAWKRFRDYCRYVNLEELPLLPSSKRRAVLQSYLGIWSLTTLL